MVTRARLGRVSAALLPSGLRALLRRRRLRRAHGLVSLGSEFDHHISSNSTFGAGCRLGGPVFIGGSTIGEYTYIEVGSRISLADVGKYCSIAPYVLIGLAEHPSDKTVSTHPLFYRRMPAFGYDLVDRDRHQELTRTRVGNDVWVGAGACVRSGVTIGDGAIIGAGAVVTRDVPPYAVYGGVPARLIRYRFDPGVISALLELRWWDRDVEWLRAHVEDMQDVDALLRHVGEFTTKGGP